MNRCVFCGAETTDADVREPAMVFWKCPACNARAIGMTRCEDGRLFDEHCYDTGYTRGLWTAICPEGCLYVFESEPV